MIQTRKLDHIVAIGLAVATVVVMWGTQRSIGYTRDESFYFSASTSYQEWFVELGRDFSHGQFLAPFRDEVIVRQWSNNHEHPVLVKICFALSHLLFHEKLHWMDDPTAFRFPAFFFSGLLTWALYWLARTYGR